MSRWIDEVRLRRKSGKTWARAAVGARESPLWRPDLPDHLREPYDLRMAYLDSLYGAISSPELPVNLRYKARERYSFGWSDPLGIYGSPGGGGVPAPLGGA